MERFIGHVVTYDDTKHCGFIGLGTITKEDGSAHDLATTSDVFVHLDDCDSPLNPWMQVIFETIPDQRRGGNALRAVAVEKHFSHELVLVGSGSGESRALTDPRMLYVPPTPAQWLMKPIAPEAVEEVLRNRPMPRVPRNSNDAHPGDSEEVVRKLMRTIFPQFEAINDGANIASEAFDDVIRNAIADHRELGMHDQATKMEQQARSYKGLRTVLCNANDLLRPETLIPIQYLPDLFMAVPVWYFWVDENTAKDAKARQSAPDPMVHAKLQHFCKLMPNQRWIDTFLMYNRRMRVLGDYQGDIIPPRIIARMRTMADLFDHLVIMTPYHDVAGSDWGNMQWLRSIDPYVVGFIKDVPLMFVVGRFSDSGIFPLHSELVADTIAFLRANVDKLHGFNRVSNPYWYEPRGDVSLSRLGDRLVDHTIQLLAAFDRGELFDWLRDEDSNVPVRT